jgi:hypothetical protein
MSTYVEYTLPGGATLLVEAPEREAVGFAKASRDVGGSVVTTAGKTFEDSLAAIKRSAEVLHQQLESLSTEEVTVTFKLKVAGELGFAIAKGGMEANYEVTLKWKRRDE